MMHIFRINYVATGFYGRRNNQTIPETEREVLPYFGGLKKNML
jgi:hypothetical protein